MPPATAATLPLPDPAPTKGLSAPQFTQLAKGGFGDGHNNFAHSMAWFKNRLYLGTTRSNMCMMRLQSAYESMPFHIYPVDCPETLDDLYKIDRRSQIWCYDPADGSWEMVFQAPMIDGSDGAPVARDIGYRSMEVFTSPETGEEALYVSTWGPGRSPGGLLMRTTDGKTFEVISPWGVLDPPMSATRSLTTFQGRMHFAPTAQRGTTGGQQNSASPQIVASAVPEAGDWQRVNPLGSGDEGNLSIFTLTPANGNLYAGTLNVEGLQIWATDGTPDPDDPALYVWRKICDRGAGRGKLNQAVVSAVEFNGALYVGTGIQGGGTDRVNGVGPAPAEVLRVNADDSVDVIVGARDDEGRAPVSGLDAGFGNFFNGYVWTMDVHDGWLYVGTFDWSVTLRWAMMDGAPRQIRDAMELVGIEDVIAGQGGCELWRTADGENWMPVTRQGFGNPYNWGIRNILSTPIGLMVGTANVFGPRVAVPDGEGWAYEANPDGGLEVWLGAPG